MKVGEIEIVPVIDGFLVSKQPSSKPLPDPGTWLWEDQHGMFRPDGMKVSSLGAFMFRTGDRLVLVDAGGGPALAGGYQPPVIDPDDATDPVTSFFVGRGLAPDAIREVAGNLRRMELQQGQLPASLDALGIGREEVTDLVFTHLHFDHIGWASADGAPFFPNATIRCSSADLEYFLPGAPEDRFTTHIYRSVPAPDRLAPVLDRIETWETDGPLFPGVDVRLAPGHTPGSSVVVLSSGTARALLLGDVVHCPLELMDDDFNFMGDHDQALANRVREAYARELEGSDVPVAASHFPGLQFGRLLPSDSEGVRRFVFDAA